MSFDYSSFFQTHGIPFVSSGKNVRQGWLNIRCPLCADDPSEHLGCNPSTGGWSCWRDRSHKGGSPAYLAQVLLGVDKARAEALVRDAGYAPPAPSDLERLMAGESLRPAVPVIMPSRYLEVEPEGATRHFYAYLKGRGFRAPRAMAQYYGVRADLGERRLILPLLTPGRGGRYGLAGWQARAIGTAALRYITYPSGDVAKRVLFNHGPAVEGSGTLAVVEGPFDAYKIDWYGRPEVRAVATLGLSCTDAQVAALYGLAPRYARLLLLLDPGAEANALRLAADLAGCGRPVYIGNVPPGVEDAGALAPDAVVPLVRRLTTI